MKDDEIDDIGSAPFLEADYHRSMAWMAGAPACLYLHPEVVGEVGPGIALKHVLFDFDGNVSWIS